MKAYESGTLDKQALLTPKEVKDILRIGSNQMYKLLTSGQLKSFKIGSARKIPVWCLQEFIESSIAAIHNSNEEMNGNDSSFKNQERALLRSHKL